MSILVEPAGLPPTTVPPNGASEPFALMVNPEMFDVPAFEVYRRLPLNASQHVAAASVGMLALMTLSVPSG